MKIIVVGCGSIGRRHIKNLKKLSVDNILVFDKEREQALKVQKECDVEILDTFEDAVKEKADAALVCTPNHTHIPIATKMVQGGKHVFIEKPLSNTLVGVHHLLREAKKRNLITMVGCNLRFHEASKKLKELLEGNIIGKIYGARMEFGNYLPNWEHPQKDYRKRYSAKASMGGGIIMDAIHDIDYACWLFGFPKKGFCFYGKFSNLEIDTEDFAEILLKFENKIVEIHLDYLQRERIREYVLIGEKGNIEIDFNEIRVKIAFQNGIKSSVFKFSGDKNQMYLDEMRHFIECIKHGREPENSVEEAIKVLEIALKAKESSNKGKVFEL